MDISKGSALAFILPQTDESVVFISHNLVPKNRRCFGFDTLNVLLYKVYSSTGDVTVAVKKCDLNITVWPVETSRPKAHSKSTEIYSEICSSDFIYKMPGLQDPCFLPCFLWDPVDHQPRQCPARINCERLEVSNQHPIHKIIN